MQYIKFGRTGLKVSRWCFGSMMLGPEGNNDRSEAQRMIDRALDAGINFFDTADVYSHGVSEEILGASLGSSRSDVVLATKFGLGMSENPLEAGASRRWIFKSVEDSLKRLGTDYIDILQMHRPDEITPPEETLDALNTLVSQGKIRYYGSSTLQPSQIAEWQWTAKTHSYSMPTSEQPPYSILVRSVEDDLLPTCEHYDLGVLVWGPMCAGWLSGRYLNKEDIELTSNRPSRRPARFDMALEANQEKLAVVNKLNSVANAAGMSIRELAHRFVLSHPAVSSAIIGPRNLAQLEDILTIDPQPLSWDVLDEIDKIVAPGRTLNAHDYNYFPPSLADKSYRRVKEPIA